jgi:hypothetical protein
VLVEARHQLTDTVATFVPGGLGCLDVALAGVDRQERLRTFDYIRSFAGSLGEALQGLRFGWSQGA